VQDLAQGRGLGIDRAGDKRGVRGQGDRQRVQRLQYRPEWGRAADLSRHRGRRELALGQPVDLVIEQQHLDVGIAPKCVDQMTGADTQPVAIAGHHPDIQIGPHPLQPGGDGRGPAMDAVQPVGVEVVREAA
jgi:hypothetical protein